jgi:hypothetical protein
VNTTERARDVYDEAIDLLMEGPIEWLGDRCNDAWYCVDVVTNLPKSPLFLYATPDGSGNFDSPEKKCGCPTQLRINKTYEYLLYAVIGPGGVERPDLTEAIGRDDRLPTAPWKIESREQLEAFAEWQRRLDQEIRGGKCPWKPRN